MHRISLKDEMNNGEREREREIYWKRDEAAKRDSERGKWLVTDPRREFPPPPCFSPSIKMKKAVSLFPLPFDVLFCVAARDGCTMHNARRYRTARPDLTSFLSLGRRRFTCKWREKLEPKCQWGKKEYCWKFAYPITRQIGREQTEKMAKVSLFFSLWEYYKQISFS